VEMLFKARSITLGWLSCCGFRPSPVSMVTRRDRVAHSCSARDQHKPGVFLPALAYTGYGLLFRLRKVPIWTSEDRPLIPVAVFGLLRSQWSLGGTV